MGFKAVATPQAREAARRVSAAQADARAAALAPVIAEIQASGLTSPHAIATALVARGIPTARGHRFWMSGQVRNLLNRLDRLPVDHVRSLPVTVRATANRLAVTRKLSLRGDPPQVSECVLAELASSHSADTA